MNKKQAFNDKTKFMLYLSIKPDLQKALEGKLQPEQITHTEENTRSKITS